jgi:hypothetical protein
MLKKKSVEKSSDAASKPSGDDKQDFAFEAAYRKLCKRYGRKMGFVPAAEPIGNGKWAMTVQEVILRAVKEEGSNGKNH